MSTLNRTPSLLVLLIGIVTGLLLVVVISLPVSSAFTPVKPAVIDTSRGQALFQQNCAGCHSIQPQGISSYGPNLHDIGQMAGQRVPGMHPQDYILESILYPEAYQVEGAGHMPAGTVAGEPEDGVRSLVAYLASLGGEIDLEHLQQLNIDVSTLAPKSPPADLARLQHGWDLFYNTLGCVACHAVNGIPGSSLRAPSLAKAGLLSADYIISSLRTPDESLADTWRVATIVLSDGRTLTGRILSENDAAIALLHQPARPGSLLVRDDIVKQDIVKTSLSEQSTMPAYSLSKEDEQALVAFLTSLVAEL